MARITCGDISMEVSPAIFQLLLDNVDKTMRDNVRLDLICDDYPMNLHEVADYLNTNVSYVRDNLIPSGALKAEAVRRNFLIVRFHVARDFKILRDSRRSLALEEMVRISQEHGEYEIY